MHPPVIRVFFQCDLQFVRTGCACVEFHFREAEAVEAVFRFKLYRLFNSLDCFVRHSIRLEYHGMEIPNRRVLCAFAHGFRQLVPRFLHIAGCVQILAGKRRQVRIVFFGFREKGKALVKIVVFTVIEKKIRGFFERFGGLSVFVGKMPFLAGIEKE